MNPKLSIWFASQFVTLVIKEYPDIKINKSDFINMSNKLKEKCNITWKKYSSDFQYINDYIVSLDITPDERKNITKNNFDYALQKSKTWHNSLKAGGEIYNEYGDIIKKFEDGFYWIDLNESYCSEEANAMGHCGNTSKGTLISLRDRKKQPHITASWDKNSGIIYQMKGKNNKKPIKAYHKYIVELLCDTELNFLGFGGEYDRVEDFNPNDLNKELYSKLINIRPKINEPIYDDEEIKDKFDNLDTWRAFSWGYELNNTNKKN